MKNLATLYETENYTYTYDARNGRVIATRKDRKAETYIYSDGTRKISFGFKSDDAAKQETTAAFQIVKGIIKSMSDAKKAEMYPNFSGLEYHEKQLAIVNIREACGFMTSEKAHYERNGIIAINIQVEGEIARERFDNE